MRETSKELRKNFRATNTGAIRDMKKELTEGMNKCLENAALVEEFGELWMAREGKLVEIVETIADTLVKKMLADYQAINN